MHAACTQDCVQGRFCTCRNAQPFGGCECSLGLDRCTCAAPRRPASPVVIRTKPSLLARVRRWWALRPLREELAGLEADYAMVFDEVTELMAAQFLPPDSTDAKMAQATLQMRRLELLDITQRRVELLARIAKAEVAA